MKENLRNALNSDLREYRSIPFWSWNNSLDESELVKQIEEMKELGIGGFIMHARTGLKDEYLGEKWFSCIKACLEKARELKMDAWVYDENGWPSGFVGGKLLENEDFRARFLEYSVGDFDNNAFAVFVKDNANGFVRVDKKQNKASEYHNIYLRISPANTDILNPAVTDAFIAETHEKYYERFKEYFGKELVGFFTDEPQYYRWGTPYTPVAEQEFRKDGEDIRDGLIWLFVHDEKGYEFRTKYFKTLNKLYTENFYKKIYDWCNDHNCKLTGHSVEESTLFMQMWGGAAVMPSYEFENIPGIDWLGRMCGNDLAIRQIASMSAQFNKNRILTESFGCSGYDVTPYELKSVAEYQYFGGINVMCQHLYPYSVAGRGRIDHPPVFGPHGNWKEGFKAFNDYFAKLSYIIANTKEPISIGVIHPMHDIWLDYIRQEDYESVKQTEEDFNDFISVLHKNGIEYHLIDECVLEKHGKIDENTLSIGSCKYDTIIVPKMRSISAATYSFLKQFSGKLCMLGAPQYIDGKKEDVSLNGNISLENVLENRRIRFSGPDGRCVLTARTGDIGEFVFVKNTDYYNSSTFEIKNAENEYLSLDLENMTEHEITDKITLKPSGSIILVKDKNAKKAVVVETENDITSNFSTKSITKNYLVIDYAEISKDGKNFNKKRAIPGIFEDLLYEDYKGDIVIRQTFTLNDKMPISLIMEKANLKFAKINGNDIEFSKGNFDINFVECDITKYIKLGENVFEYSIYFYQHEGVHFALFDPLATESLRNCLYYDTSIQNIYLRGDFVVNDDFSLSKTKKLPEITNELYKTGYPFFKGELTIFGKVDKSKYKRTILSIDGRFMTAKIKANGKEKLFTFGGEGDITDLLIDGENEVSITLNSSMRNIFGPHHFNMDEDPMGVSPYNFEFGGRWKGGNVPADFTDKYHFVPFGVRKITIKEKN